MPNKIVSRKVIEEVVVEHTCLSGSGEQYRVHASTGELSKGHLYWSNMSPNGDVRHCTRCGEKLPRNISEVEGKP